MHDEIKISVIIPAYNAAKYIESTLRSIYGQTVLPHEVIVVDDDSKDSTADIVKKFPCRLVQQKNQGPATARNNGILSATGNWIAFIDADDLWDANKIKTTLEFLKKNPQVRMLSTNMFAGNEDVGWKKIDLSSRFNLSKPFFPQLYRRSFIATSTVVVFKDLLVQEGLFSSVYMWAEDFDLWLRLARKKTPFEVLPDYLTYYRTHSSSLTAKLTKPYAQTKSVLFNHKNHVSFLLFTVRILILNVEVVIQNIRQRDLRTSFRYLVISIKDLIVSPYYYFKKA